MRLVVAGLMVASLLVVAPAPGASACRIDLSDPTAPGWSGGCTDPDRLITIDTVEADVSTEAVTDTLSSQTSVCDYEESLCNQALDAQISVDRSGPETLDLNVQTSDSGLFAEDSFRVQVHQPAAS